MGFEESKYVPRKIAENDILCPACKTPIKLEIYEHQTPVEGSILIFVANCPSCGYRYREAVPATQKDKGVRITVRIESEDSLKLLIYRSPRAHISLPELSLEVVPGPANPGEITTVEGLLLHIAENLYPLCDTTDNPAKCYEVVSKLVNISNGIEKATLVILDPSGLSTVIRGDPSLYRVEELQQESQESSEAKSVFRVVIGSEAATQS